ncbi:MAG TPA: hypothetical protein VG962_08110 [Steroidobacteraceae bacterium]|nr:hypothetical protein [Steroidobacteraceae bacterium]
MIDIHRHGFFVKLFSSAILMQALLSGANLIVGMLLIRHTTNAQYGYYVLVSTAILLMTSIQNAYIQPSMVVKLTRAADDPQSRGDFVGSLHRDQVRLLPGLAAIAIAIALTARLMNWIDTTLLWIVIAGACAVTANLFREFFRMVLLAYRRPGDVVRGDALYVLVLIIGAVIAIQLPFAAAAMAGLLAVAAIVGGGYQRRSLRANEPWNPRAKSGALKSIYSVGVWAVIGAAIHWSFTQGYNYLVVGVLGVNDVAAIAATRILMMPVNLVSSGVSTFMFPTVAGWLKQHRVPVVLKRIYLFTSGLVVLALGYLLILWFMRDWIFTVVLRKHFEHRDELLILWSVICITMVLRDQLAYTLIAHTRFRQLSALAAVSAVIALSTSVIAMKLMGQPGALIGILSGEGISVLGVLVMGWHDAKQVSPVAKDA